MPEDNLKTSVLSSLFWKFLERGGSERRTIHCTDYPRAPAPPRRLRYHRVDRGLHRDLPDICPERAWNRPHPEEEGDRCRLLIGILPLPGDRACLLLHPLPRSPRYRGILQPALDNSGPPCPGPHPLLWGRKHYPECGHRTKLPFSGNSSSAASVRSSSPGSSASPWPTRGTGSGRLLPSS